MSNTRHAEPGTSMRQNKFCSSPEFERGLLANLVSKRCRVATSQEERYLLQSLQWLSHQDGGLAKVAQSLISSNPGCLMSPSMEKHGCRKGQVYTGNQVQEIRNDLPYCYASDYRLRGENESDFSESRPALQFPAQYPSEKFVDACRESAAGSLASYLEEVCLNPSVSIMDSASPWYFRGLPGALRRYIESHNAVRRSGIVMTELSKALFSTLNYGLESRCMVVVEGLARTGKTFSAEAWCAMNPGRARYVQVPSTGDDIGFFRAISEGLGSSAGSCMKATQMREKIEDALHPGDIMVVFDEAHYLLPQRNLRYAIPNRLNWVMTGLVNRGVPVALVTTPQFANSQNAIEQKTGWAAEQFIGRIGHWERLPDRLSESDLEAVARHLLPNGDKRSIEALVAYAQGSAKYLAGIETAARRARYLAHESGRDQVTFPDVKEAIQGGVIPSDTALAKAFRGDTKNRRHQAMSMTPVIPAEKGFSMPMQERCIVPETTVLRGNRAMSGNIIPELRAQKVKVPELVPA